MKNSGGYFSDPWHHNLLHFIIWGEMSSLEIPVTRETEIAWQMEQNLKHQCLKSTKCCASSVQCCTVMQQQNQKCRLPNLTHPPLWVLCCFNVPSWIDSTPSFQKSCQVNTFQKIRKDLSGRCTFFIFADEEMKCPCIPCSCHFFFRVKMMKTWLIPSNNIQKKLISLFAIELLNFFTTFHMCLICFLVSTSTAPIENSLLCSQVKQWHSSLFL